MFSTFAHRDHCTFEMKKGSWDSNNLKLAMNKVLNQKMVIRKASEHFKIPKSTLFEKIKLLKQGKEVELKPVMGRFKKTFSEECEQLMEDIVTDLANDGTPMTKKQFLMMAYDKAQKQKLPHRFNNKKKVAGKDFYDSYMRRHPNLSLIGNRIFSKKTNDKKQVKEGEVKPSEEEKYSCIVCCEEYVCCDEDWVQCLKCVGWAHEACANIPGCSIVYVCGLCKCF